MQFDCFNACDWSIVANLTLIGYCFKLANRSNRNLFQIHHSKGRMRSKPMDIYWSLIKDSALYAASRRWLSDFWEFYLHFLKKNRMIWRKIYWVMFGYHLPSENRAKVGKLSRLGYSKRYYTEKVQNFHVTLSGATPRSISLSATGPKISRNREHLSW